MASPQPAIRASIVIPTRGRPDYLKVALASIEPQAGRAGAETIVVDDGGPDEQARRLAARFGARYEPHPSPQGLNAARNTGLERSSGELLVFVDDDIQACEGWLAALVARAQERPDVEVLAGRIVPRLEGRPPHGCGREGPPITSLELGPTDRPTSYAWGSNMAIRRDAFERIGQFDPTLSDGGDEQEWQDRLHAAGGSVLYVADAAVLHRRAPRDARLRALCRASYARGRGARRFEAWRGQAPSLARELLTLAGCLGHVVRRRCPAGLTMAAHSAGRLRQALAGETGQDARSGPASASNGALAPSAAPADDFLSGESGTVGGLDRLRRELIDTAEEALRTVSGERRRLRSAAACEPPARDVVVLSVQRPERRRLAEAALAELERSRHRVELRVAEPGERGKFENLNDLLGERPPSCDWLVVLDDDVRLPHCFLDGLLLVCERLRLDLAQPAHAAASHAAWRVTRRRRGSLARETQFVEIGPVTVFGRPTFESLLPFPPLRMGWGLDLHWGALARRHGWRCGVVDALAIRHIAAPAAQGYSREQALAEARAFLSDHAHLSAREAQRTLAIHRRL